MSLTVWEFQHSIDCDAPRPFVWTFWTDVSNWQKLEGEAVEWCSLDGPFAEGTHGETKSRGQAVRRWRLSEVVSDESATIEMTFGVAIFATHMKFDVLPNDRTRISQRMSLVGEVALAMLEGVKLFETTAPQGLAKLASVIEAERKSKE